MGFYMCMLFIRFVAFNYINIADFYKPIQFRVHVLIWNLGIFMGVGVLT